MCLAMHGKGRATSLADNYATCRKPGTLVLRLTLRMVSVLPYVAMHAPPPTPTPSKLHGS